MRISDWSSDVCSSDLLAMCWVGLLSAGVPYPVFWWVAALAMCGAWIRHLRCGTHGPPAARTGKHAAWIVACVVVAAICVVLVAHPPNADHAFSVRFPATPRRFPEHSLRLH